MENDNRTIPKEFSSLFWEVDPGTVDLETHANYVIERFLEYGTLEGVRWLRTVYSDEKLVRFLREKSFRIRSQKTLNFWRLMLNIPQSEWTNLPSRISSEHSLSKLA